MAGDVANGVVEQLRQAGPGSCRNEFGNQNERGERSREKIRQKRGDAMSKLTMKTEGDTHIVVTRRFAAPPEAVYRAHTDPQLIQKWMLGPDGWTMPVCIYDPRPGGKMRFEWSNVNGGRFYLTGENLELVPYSRLVHVERMHLPD